MAFIPRLLPSTITVGAILLVMKAITLGLALVAVAPYLPSMVFTQAAVAAPASEPEHHVAQAETRPVPAAVTLPSVPPPEVSDAERQLLQDLRGRRQELDARERTLAEREGVLDAAEQRLNARVTQLKDLQTRLEQLEADRQHHNDENWAGLVKVYETMKPRDAAVIFNDMDVPVLLQVLDRMKEAKVAPILAAMAPDRARLVTTQLANQRAHALDVPPSRSTAG